MYVRERKRERIYACVWVNTSCIASTPNFLFPIPLFSHNRLLFPSISCLPAAAGPRWAHRCCWCYLLQACGRRIWWIMALTCLIDVVQAHAAVVFGFIKRFVFRTRNAFITPSWSTMYPCHVSCQAHYTPPKARQHQRRDKERPPHGFWGFPAARVYFRVSRMCTLQLYHKWYGAYLLDTMIRYKTDFLADLRREQRTNSIACMRRLSDRQARGPCILERRRGRGTYAKSRKCRRQGTNIKACKFLANAARFPCG